MFRHFAATSVLTLSAASVLIGATPAMAAIPEGVGPQPHDGKAKVQHGKAQHGKRHKAKHRNGKHRNGKHRNGKHRNGKHHNGDHHNGHHHKIHKFHKSIKIHKKSDDDKFSNKAEQRCNVFVFPVTLTGNINIDNRCSLWQENEGDENEIKQG